MPTRAMSRRSLPAVALLAAMLVAPLPGRAGAQGAPGATSGPGRGDWVTYNGSLAGDRYSPLTEVTTANVSRLRRVCAFDTPDTVSFQSGIVAAGGMLYFTTFNNTWAIDGATCQQRWKQTRAEPPTFLKVNRGVAYMDGRLFRGTGDGHVLALDAATGRVLWDAEIANPKIGESVPMAPVAWNGLVFVGNAGGDNFGVTGRIYALDAATGRVAWQFKTLPDTGWARRTWTRASDRNPPTGGALWTSFAVDAPNGVLYVSTGNPGPDFVQALHPGRSLYSNSVLALDARSGRVLAWVQPVRNDFHDYDVSAAPALITNRGGVPFLLAAAKDGYVYGIDRSRVSANGGPGSDSTSLRVRFAADVATHENGRQPLSSTRFTRFCPGTQGGVEWNGPTYHPEAGLLVVNSIDWCTSVKLQPLDTLHGAPGMPWTGMDDPMMAFGKQDPVSRWRGWITAADARTGRVRWRKRTPKPMVAGITSTAGGLVFTGDLDGNVLALDARTGRELWRDATGKAIGGSVMSYDAGGRQYVAAAAGLNSAIWPVKGGTATVVIYALPASR